MNLRHGDTMTYISIILFRFTNVERDSSGINIDRNVDFLNIFVIHFIENSRRKKLFQSQSTDRHFERFLN